jgi:hypothetical protein
MAGITSGGGAAARCGDTFPVGSMAEASTRAGECSSSPWWLRALVQVLVKCGGAARRWGGRRRRRRRNGVEVEEAGEAGALDDGGSGSSHGRLRSLRRTALPQAAPIPPSPPFTSPSPPAGWWWTGEWVPLRRLGLGDPRVSAAALIAAGGAGHVDGWDALGDAGRAATARPRPARAALALAVIKSGKGGGMTKATSARPQRDAARGPHASDGAPRGGRWCLAGSVLGRG